MNGPIPNLVFKLDISKLMAYGGATWDWHRLHYDTELARSRGFAGPVVDGQMFGALIARQIRKWAGPRARFIEMEFKNQQVVTAPSLVTVSSQVIGSAVVGGATQIDVASTIHDDVSCVIIKDARTRIEV
jgi:acyl dehydratase